MATIPNKSGNNTMAGLSEKDQEVLESRLDAYQQQLLISWDMVERMTTGLKISVVLNIIQLIAFVGLLASI